MRKKKLEKNKIGIVAASSAGFRASASALPCLLKALEYLEDLTNLHLPHCLQQVMQEI